MENKLCKLAIYFIMTILAYLGYSIKPHCMIVFIAILLMEFAGCLKKNNFKKIGLSFFILFGILVSFYGLQKGLEKVYAKEGFIIDKEQRFGVSHYLMLGLNEERNGGWVLGDVEFSNQYPTYKERSVANMEEVVGRLKKMGPGGLVKHIIKKILTTYNDGTYAWGYEGNFYATIYEEPNSVMSPFLRSIYYSNEQGTRHEWYVTFEQVVWIFVLVMCIFSCINRDGDKGKDFYVLLLSIIGLTLYEILFEVRARYLYTYAPIYCIIAACGLRNAILIFTGVYRQCKNFHIVKIRRGRELR